jgi:hypothetical protein
MKAWQGILVLAWVEVIAFGLAWVHYLAYRDPSRNRVTRLVDGYWQSWLKHPMFGFGLFRSSREKALEDVAFQFFELQKV